MESVQIATRMLTSLRTIQPANLNNRQQTALANAATYAAMDKANLSTRLQGAVTEAQALLSVDLKNLDNKQKSDTLTYSSLVQGLFKDAAEDNARKQFNAKNELQAEEFFAELGSQVEMANKNHDSHAAVNTSEANAMSQFTTKSKTRERSSKHRWVLPLNSQHSRGAEKQTPRTRRCKTEANRMDVMNMYNATMTAMSNLWQQMRDNASWNFTKAENDLARRHDLAAIAMQFANSPRDVFQRTEGPDGRGLLSSLCESGDMTHV